MRDSRDDLLVEYYASHRASAIINYNEISKNITSSLHETQRPFCFSSTILIIRIILSLG